MKEPADDAVDALLSIMAETNAEMSKLLTQFEHAKNPNERKKILLKSRAKLAKSDKDLAKTAKKVGWVWDESGIDRF